MPSDASPLRRKAARSPRHWRNWLLRHVALWSVVVGALYVGYLDLRIREEFEGKRWAIPARVYGRALELYPGLALSPKQLAQELSLLKYQSEVSPSRPGTFARRGDEFQIFSRPFTFWDGAEAALNFRVRFDGGQVFELVQAQGGAAIPLARLDPFQLATIVPTQHEDRILLRREELPPSLVQALIAIEDRRFYEHMGLDGRGVVRAMFANLRAFDWVQGGSTLTQQLVKNYFLANERTLGRKLNEAIMALLLELHYSKDEILAAYCNEVFLGQDGARAIHGFGLAARFYFGNDLSQLQLSEWALLVGMVKGASYYDPRRHPQRARERRDQVLRAMVEHGDLTAATMTATVAEPLGVAPEAAGSSRFPAYMDLVRRQLRSDYRDEDLRSDGVQIFTPLDPAVQLEAEQALARQLDELERGSKRREELQGAVVVTNPSNGEVLAVVGDRNGAAGGFNRALSAERQIGSLVKPAVYLTALRSPGYSLISPLSDAPISLTDHQGKVWSPNNFDNVSHGTIPLVTALAQSYNVATVRLGLELGVPQVVATLRDLGIKRALSPYPSLFLGTPELTPFEVTQMYQTLAGGGFFTPLRGIRAVMSADGKPLQRYGFEVQQNVAPEAVYLLNVALQEVARSGTAHALSALMHGDRAPVVKTGTTNDLRDSWFAGFTQDRLAVVWVGRDDNQSAGLTGASGAMRVWGDLMRQHTKQALQLAAPESIEWAWVEPETQWLSDERCPGALYVPFVKGRAPTEPGPCWREQNQNPLESTVDWVRGLFQ